MKHWEGPAISTRDEDGIVAVTLHHDPVNEIGSTMLTELEEVAACLSDWEESARAVVFVSEQTAGFSAGADLRELYGSMQGLSREERTQGVASFLDRIHTVFRRFDETSLVTLAAVHGIVFGGGFELALTADLIIADRTTRFCFPELRLGLIPGFGGIPRLSRDLGNAVVRDLLLTGRSLGAKRAYEVGLVSQLVREGGAFIAAKSTALQTTRFEAETRRTAKTFLKPSVHEAIEREKRVFLELFARPEVENALRTFVESKDPMPYLPSSGVRG